MSIFLNRDDLVAVSLPDEPENVVWIRRKMDLGTKNRVQDSLMSVQDAGTGGQQSTMSINLGKSNTVLLQFNIVRWEGPKFRDDNGQPIPCTPYMIEAMDPDDPLVDAVLERINALNARRVTFTEAGKPESPKPPTPASSKNGATESRQPVALTKQGVQ